MSINATIAVPYFVMKDYLTGSWPHNRISAMAENYDKVWIISITNPNMPVRNDNIEPLVQDGEDRIALQFHDIDSPDCDSKTIPFNKDMAQKIVDFLAKANEGESNDLLVVNCHMGISRSGAVADFARSVFEKGQRTSPPSGIVVVAVPVRMTRTMGSAALEIQEIGSFDEAIADVWEHLGSVVVTTHQSVYLDNRRTGDGTKGVIAGVGFTRSNKPVTARFFNGFDLEDQVAHEQVSSVLNPSEVMSYNGTLYARTGDKILAVTLTEVGSQNKVLAGPVVAANVLEHATRLYPGTAIQSLLGACYVSLFPVVGTHHQIRIAELDGVRIQDAKYDNKVLMVVGFKKGVYNRWIFRFDDEFQTYDTRVIPDIKPEGLNFVTLDSGICVSMTEDETLELFPNTKGVNKSRVVADPMLSGEMSLYKKGGKVVFAKENKLYSLSLK